MPLIAQKMIRDITTGTSFNGIATNHFMTGIANGVIRAIKEATLLTILFTGAAGSPGSANMIGIVSANPGVFASLLVPHFVGKHINGMAMPFLANGFGEIAKDLQTDSLTSVPSVTNGTSSVATGTGTITPGAIQMNSNLASNIIKYEMVRAGIHDSQGKLTSAAQNMVEALAEGLSAYLLTLTYVIPVVGGTPSGSATFPLTGRFLS